MIHADLHTEIIEPKNSRFNLRIKELWHYRDLLKMFVKRDFIATYKQTLLGPLWFFIQPILTTLMFTIVFGKLGGFSTDDQPKILFYFAGVTIWNYFSDCFNKTSTVFKDNAQIFGKVYFPRLLTPLAIVVSGLIRFGIQFSLFMVIFAYYYFQTGSHVHPTPYVLLTPLLIILMAGFALGAGMIISAMTSRYRDLIFLVSFGIQLLMYATPIIYSVASLKAKNPAYAKYAMLNPLSGVVETFRFAYLGSGTFSWSALGYSTGCMLLLLLYGTYIFNKVEKTFMDTV